MPVSNEWLAQNRSNLPRSTHAEIVDELLRRRDPIETELEALRKAQVREVMPIIGPLLDAWQGLPNDVSDVDELMEVADYMEALEQAMDADPDSQSDAGAKP